ncbi:abortive infection family protein [Flavobacterium pectinovorum]|uniref:abortive infection family protein n=1 Tax=Flavobacterium pectinovorum TaxID=29533 RepID=UPI00265D8525|nr:abortive infection family protein [Flavobacterium pectinovorum]WKL47938.1 abortive infection family protein [Flavobacterium pectinovorum]
MDLISKKTRSAFEDYFSSESTLRIISKYFNNHDIHQGQTPIGSTVSGQRRQLVEQYFHYINWRDPIQVRQVLNVFEDIIGDLIEEYNNSNSNIKEWIHKLTNALLKDGYKYENYKLNPIGQATNFESLKSATNLLDKTHFQEHIDRINKSINDDPALAIGSTKELVESILKSILIELNIEIDKADDIPKLLKKVQKGLDIVPNDVDNSIKGAEIIKVLLNNLGSVVIKLTELRNLYGTGHGTDKKRNGLSPRHARLAVGAGITLSTFLLDTFEYKRTK